MNKEIISLVIIMESGGGGGGGMEKRPPTSFSPVTSSNTPQNRWFFWSNPNWGYDNCSYRNANFGHITLSTL